MTSLLCAVAILFGAEAFDKEFHSANDLYAAGNFTDAAKGYERVVASGAVSPEVFFNLGNAYYKAGHLGPAIANYERAVSLRPGFAEASENLQKAIGETKNQLPKPLRPAWQQGLLFWDTGLTFGLSRGASILLWLGFWGLLTGMLFRRIPYGRALAVLLLGLAMLSGLSAWCKAHPLPLAVGAVDSAPVRYGTSDSDEVRFELAEGDRVAVEDRVHGWLLVRSVDGVRGWVLEGQVCLVGPPYEPAPTGPSVETGK